MDAAKSQILLTRCEARLSYQGAKFEDEYTQYFVISNFDIWNLVKTKSKNLDSGAEVMNLFDYIGKKRGNLSY